MITIPEAEYKRIISCLGYPVVKEEDLEFGRDDIQDLFIYPAMREFFTWFPIQEEVSYPASSSFEFDFPDADTYGIVSARLNSRASAAGSTTNPFVNEINYRVVGSSGYGTGNDYGFRQADIMERAELVSSLSQNRAIRIRVDEVNRKVKGSTTASGELIVVWAKHSMDFNAIPFKKQAEVVKLAKAYTLSGFAMLRDQYDADMGTEFDTSGFKDEARKLEEEVMEKWKTLSKVVVIRN